MSSEYKNTNPLKIAKQAEQDLNSHTAKHGHDQQGRSYGAADSTLDSGIDDSATRRFAGGGVTYGSAASGVGNNREIPTHEGGDINPVTGRPYKARDYEGAGGPGDKAAIDEIERPGDQNVRSNVK